MSRIISIGSCLKERILNACLNGGSICLSTNDFESLPFEKPFTLSAKVKKKRILFKVRWVSHFKHWGSDYPQCYYGAEDSYECVFSCNENKKKLIPLGRF